MKRRRVDDRTAVPVALIAGIVAALSGASPTGTTWSDWVVIVGSVTLVTWAGASTPWWAASALAAVAALTAGSIPLALIGIGAFAVGLWIGVQRRDVPLVRAAVVGVGLNVMIRSELEGFLGLSAIIGIASGITILAIGLARRRTRIRRRVYWGLAAVGGIAIVAIVGSAVAAASSRSDLTSANRLARDGLELVGDGDYLGASVMFDQAATAFDGADSSLSAPWALPARLIPVVSQNLGAAQDLSSAAADASEDLSTALGVVDPEQLRLVDGRFDLDAIRLIQEPFRSVQGSIAALEAVIDESASPWLIEPVEKRLTDLDEELADNAERLDNAVLAVDLAPQLLGADDARRYFIAFTTPAEARGAGGFMGNWAEITADDGRLAITGFGRTRDLNVGGERPRTLTDPDEFVEQWGPYGLTADAQGNTRDAVWSNVTISPEFPSTGQVIAELYPQSGGRELDGVFAMDPFVLEALLGLTGPISIEGADGQLSERNVVEFLLVDQYTIDDSSTRIDLLDEVARGTIEEVLRGALPTPTVVARELGPLAAQGRLAGWARDPAEQELFERVSLDAGLPDLDGGDGYAVVVNNAGANKLDVYLERTVDYEATVDPVTGAVEATMTVTLTNDAALAGLPEVVTGNYTGDEEGSNRALVSLYSPLTVADATVEFEGSDEELLGFARGVESGWGVNTATLNIPPGESVTLTVQLEGTVDPTADYTLVVRPHPLVRPEQHTIAVTTSDGLPLVTSGGVIDRPTRFSTGDVVAG